MMAPPDEWWRERQRKRGAERGSAFPFVRRGRPGAASPYLPRWAFSILAHSSFRETARLKTRLPPAESGSTQK